MPTADLIRRARELAKLRKKATPGPWRAAPIKRVTEYGKRYIDGYDIYMRLEGYPREVMGGTVGGYNWGEGEAALIAAAPEMAELLEYLAGALEQQEAPTQDEPVMRLRGLAEEVRAIGNQIARCGHLSIASQAWRAVGILQGVADALEADEQGGGDAGRG